MITFISKKLVTLVLIVLLAVPSALLISPPPKAHALLPTIELSGIGTLLVEAYNLVKNTLTSAAVIAQEALQYLFYIKEYVLEPLAFIQSGKAVQALTGGMLGFVSGQSSGQPQFVQNLPGRLNDVGGNASAAFLRQFQSNSNSPYAGVIASSIGRNYAEQSTLAGFFAANRNTLPQYSRNPNAFLAGNWSEGGINAWFALTTQGQNNPYMLYQRSSSAHAKLVLGARETHEKVLDWGEGFLSWCGEGTATAEAEKECNMSNNFCGSGDEAAGLEQGPVSVGAPCTQKDGTPGIIQTPGTTITKYFDKSLSLDADKLTAMGNAATQITELVGTLMQTVQMAQIVIGGPGGLAGVGTPVNGKSVIDQYTNPDTPYAGVNQCSINHTLLQNLQTAAGGTADLEARIDPYVEAWGTIGEAATAASASVTALRDLCTTSAQSPQASATFIARANNIIQQANTALNKGAPDGILYVLNKATTAPDVAAASLATRDEVFAGLASDGTGDPLVCTDYSGAATNLRSLPPTASDLAYAQGEAIDTGVASAVPPDSLILPKTPGTLVDKMNLLVENSEKLLNECEL